MNHVPEPSSPMRERNTLIFRENLTAQPMVSSKNTNWRFDYGLIEDDIPVFDATFTVPASAFTWPPHISSYGSRSPWVLRAPSDRLLFVKIVAILDDNYDRSSVAPFRWYLMNWKMHSINNTLYDEYVGPFIAPFHWYLVKWKMRLASNDT